MRQILEGMEYVHKQKIVHLDLKPENIVCVDTTGMQIKIIDFGLACKLGEIFGFLLTKPSIIPHCLYFYYVFLIPWWSCKKKLQWREGQQTSHMVAVWFENQAGLLCHRKFPVLVAQVYIILTTNVGRQSHYFYQTPETTTSGSIISKFLDVCSAHYKTNKYLNLMQQSQWSQFKQKNLVILQLCAGWPILFWVSTEIPNSKSVTRTRITCDAAKCFLNVCPFL